MKRKGFTLVELLVVIVIIALLIIIALISIIMILNKYKKKAYVVDANEMVGSVKELAVTDTSLLPKHIDNPTYIGISDIKLQSGTGTKSPYGSLYSEDSYVKIEKNSSTGSYTYSISLVDNDGNGIEETPIDSLGVEDVKLGNAESNNPTAIYYPNGTVIYFNPVSGEKCSASESVNTTGTKTGCMKWHAFNDKEGKSSLNLLLDHNTTESFRWSMNNTNINGPIRVLTQLRNDTDSWIGVPTRTDKYTVDNETVKYTIDYTGYKAKLITANEIAKITGNTWFNEATNTNRDFFFFETNTSTQPIPHSGVGTYGWLYNNTLECKIYGCEISDSSTNGYWTGTAVKGTIYLSWSVGRGGALGNNAVGKFQDIGIRPAIKILKSKIK